MVYDGWIKLVGDSIAGGIVSAITLFLILRGFLTPKIDISPQIQKGPNSKGRRAYRIKIINRRHRPVIDIKAYLHVVRRTGNSTVEATKALTLTRPEHPTGLAGKRWFLRDERHDFAYRFLTYDPLEDLLAEEDVTALWFRMNASDGLSGVRRVFSRRYEKGGRWPIIEGRFSDGDNLVITGQSFDYTAEPEDEAQTGNDD